MIIVRKEILEDDYIDVDYNIFRVVDLSSNAILLYILLALKKNGESFDKNIFMKHRKLSEQEYVEIIKELKETNFVMITKEKYRVGFIYIGSTKISAEEVKNKWIKGE